MSDYHVAEMLAGKNIGKLMVNPQSFLPQIYGIFISVFNL